MVYRSSDRVGAAKKLAGTVCMHGMFTAESSLAVESSSSLV